MVWFWNISEAGTPGSDRDVYFLTGSPCAIAYDSAEGDSCQKEHARSSVSPAWEAACPPLSTDARLLTAVMVAGGRKAFLRKTQNLETITEKVDTHGNRIPRVIIKRRGRPRQSICKATCGQGTNLPKSWRTPVNQTQKTNSSKGKSKNISKYFSDEEHK